MAAIDFKMESSDSVSDALGQSQHSESKVDLVKSIWSRLGVGDSGYLSLEDLTTVCHAIGMENNAKELFARLDLDGDGKISFDEFLHLFQKGVGDQLSSPMTSVEGPSAPSKATLSHASTKQKRPNSNTAAARVSSMAEDLTSGGVMPLLFPIESSSPSGSLPVWRVLQQWEAHGISDGGALLQDLGLPHSPGDVLGLQELMAAVEEECQAPRDSVTNKQALTLLLLQETKHLRNMVESAWCERDKVRSDLALTTHRLSSQAQELDDHTLALEATANQHIQSVEKQHQEALRVLQERLSSEREAREHAATSLAEVTQQVESLTEQLCIVKTQLNQTKKTCEKLEGENCDLVNKLESASASLSDTQALNARLRNQKETRGAEKDSSSPGMERMADEVEWQELLSQLNKLRQDNQSLRDTNDELVARIDQLTLHSPLYPGGSNHATQQPHYIVGTGDISLDGSCMGDYLLPSSLAANTTANSTAANTSLNFSHGPSSDTYTAFSTPGASRLKRSSDEDPPSPRDVSSAGRRSSPDLLSPRAGKIARCAAFSPPPTSSMGSTDVCQAGSEGLHFYSNSQPASLELHLSSLGSFHGRTVSSSASVRHRRVASTNSVVTSGGFSCSSGSLSPSASAPHSARRPGGRGTGLEAELAGVRVEVASLVQQRDHLASCVASMQIQNDNQTHQLSEWEAKIKSLLSEIQPVRPDSEVSVTEDNKVSATEDPAAAEDAETASEVSSSLHDSPRKSPPDISSLLTTFQVALQTFKEKETTLRKGIEVDLQTSEREKAELQDRCSHLDAELSAVKTDLDKSEEYWLLKLQEEQDYYEEERKVYDENFAKLEAKITEYEAASKQRLSPIDESALFEEQVTLLESELRDVEAKLEKALTEKDSAVREASEIQSKYESECQKVRQLENTIAFDNKSRNASPIDEKNRNSSVSEKKAKSGKRNGLALTELLKGCKEQQKIKTEGLEAALSAAQHHMYHHTVQQTEQMRRAEKADELTKELFLENAELMRALYLAEARQKKAEEKLRQKQLSSACCCSSSPR